VDEHADEHQDDDSHFHQHQDNYLHRHQHIHANIHKLDVHHHDEHHNHTMCAEAEHGDTVALLLLGDAVEGHRGEALKDSVA